MAIQNAAPNPAGSARGEPHGDLQLRPWGAYRVVHSGPGFQVKQLTITPDGQLSLQKHARRAEHWIVVGGVAEVELDGETLTLRKDESVYIPIGAVHRLANRFAENLEVIEVQTGDYLGEDDIVRLADIYART